MIRHLIPRFEWGGWCGDGPADRNNNRDATRGGCFCVQWLGLIVEIGAGRVQGER
jgi:hypothetical protein